MTESTTAQLLQLHLATLKNLTQNKVSVWDTKIKECFQRLDTRFAPGAKLHHPGEIYSIYGALTQITEAVNTAKNDQVTAQWTEILQELKDRKVYLIGQGEI